MHKKYFYSVQWSWYRIIYRQCPRWFKSNKVEFYNKFSFTFNKMVIRMLQVVESCRYCILKGLTVNCCEGISEHFFRRLFGSDSERLHLKAVLNVFLNSSCRRLQEIFLIFSRCWSSRMFNWTASVVGYGESISKRLLK